MDFSGYTWVYHGIPIAHFQNPIFSAVSTSWFTENSADLELECCDCAGRDKCFVQKQTDLAELFLWAYVMIYKLSYRSYCFPFPTVKGHNCKIWGFPEMGVPPNHPFIDGFSMKPSSYWVSIIYGNHHLPDCVTIVMGEMMS